MKRLVLLLVPILASCASPYATQEGSLRPSAPAFKPKPGTTLGEKIREHIAFNVPSDWNRNDPAEYSVTLFPDGSVREIVLMSSSGLPGFDAAVRRAIEVSQPYPRVGIPGSPPGFILQSRPWASYEMVNGRIKRIEAK